MWTQHVNHFREKGIREPDPRKIFDDHLIEAVKEWMDLGDNVIIGIDMNDDVRTGHLAKRLNVIGLQDGILKLHPNSSPPSTFDGNDSRTPIDAIFVSAAVEIRRGGYMPFDSGIPSAPSDGHRMLWVEIDNYSILGKDIPLSTQSITTNPVDSKDPRVRKSFSIKVKKEYTRQNVFNIRRNIIKQVKEFKLGKINNKNICQ